MQIICKMSAECLQKVCRVCTRSADILQTRKQIKCTNKTTFIYSEYSIIQEHLFFINNYNAIVT